MLDCLQWGKQVGGAWDARETLERACKQWGRYMHANDQQAIVPKHIVLWMMDTMSRHFSFAAMHRGRLRSWLSSTAHE